MNLALRSFPFLLSWVKPILSLGFTSLFANVMYLFLSKWRVGIQHENQIIATTWANWWPSAPNAAYNLGVAQAKSRDGASEDHFINPTNIYQLLCGILFSMEWTVKTKPNSLLSSRLHPTGRTSLKYIEDAWSKDDHRFGVVIFGQILNMIGSMLP